MTLELTLRKLQFAMPIAFAITASFAAGCAGSTPQPAVATQQSTTELTSADAPVDRSLPAKAGRPSRADLVIDDATDVQKSPRRDDNSRRAGSFGVTK